MTAPPDERLAADETREFPSAVLASLSSGVLLCKFDALHEAAEFLMGHPIWTHHFASRNLWKQMQETLVAQHPGLPLDLPGVTSDNYQESIEEIENKLGASLVIRKGSGSTAMHPLDGIPERLPVTIIAARDGTP